MRVAGSTARTGATSHLRRQLPSSPLPRLYELHLSYETGRSDGSERSSCKIQILDLRSLPMPLYLRPRRELVYDNENVKIDRKTAPLRT